MMGSERVVGTRAGDPAEVSGIVPQSLVELFRLLDERAEAGSGGGDDDDETETWKVRVGYLQVYIVSAAVFLVCGGAARWEWENRRPMLFTGEGSSCRWLDIG